MLKQSDTYATFMMDFASGTLAPGLSLAGELHVALSSEGRLSNRIWEAAAGALLEIGPEEDGAIRNLRPKKAVSLPRCDEVLSYDLYSTNWRKSWLAGIDIAPLGSPDARLIKLKDGQSVPQHNHSEFEATVVLSGSFSDEFGNYSVGDIVFSDSSVSHAPRVISGEDCICYVGRQSGWSKRLTYALGIYDA